MTFSPIVATLLCHARDTLQGRQVAFLENGRPAQRVEVKLDGYRLAARRRHRPAGGAQHPLDIVGGPGLLPFVGLGKEVEDSPRTVVAWEAQSEPPEIFTVRVTPWAVVPGQVNCLKSALPAV